MKRLTEAGVAKQLVALRGNVAAVGRAFGVSRQAVAKYIASRPKLQATEKDAREEMLDNAESALYKAAIAGEAWAVCFILKTQGRSRGYVERTETEVSGRGGGELRVVVIRERAFFGHPTAGAVAASDSDSVVAGAIQDGGLREAVGQDGPRPDGND